MSNVLRGTRFVRAELQQRVQEAIASLRYSPNPLAMGLRAQRSRTIGVVVPDITIAFFAAVVRRVEMRAAYTDYQILLADSQEDAQWEQKRVAALVNRHIDGLIVIPCRDDSPALADLRSSKIPIILVDRVGQENRFDSVSANNVEASREGTRYLISLGHKRILFLAGDPGLRNIQERIEGYREALRIANQSKFEQVMVAGRKDVEGVMRVLEPVLSKRPRPSAIFAATQVMTLGALKVIWKIGLIMPKDISLLAFDDSEWLTALRPFISTVSQPADEFADEAWATLMTRLSKDRSPKLHSEVHCTLIPRESTGKFRG